MFGVNVNHLNMYAEFGHGERELVFSLNGMQANEWIESKHTLITYSPIRVLLEGVAGTDIKGDIAIDDITLDYNQCPTDVRISLF